MKKKQNRVRIAIYTGVISDTNFIDLLVNSLARRGFVIQLFGFNREERSDRLDRTNIKRYVIPRNVFGRILYVVFYAIRVCFFHPEKFTLSVKTKLIRTNSIRDFFKSGARVLPIIFHRPDIIHFQWIKSLTQFPGIERVTNAKIVVSLRGDQVSVSPFIDDNVKAEYKKIFNHVHAIHSISDDLTTQALVLGAPTHLITKINPAIEIRNFPFRGFKMLNKSIYRIITIARLHWKKGFDYSLQAVRMLKESGINCEYVIVGSGPQTDEIKYAIRDYKLQDVVKLKGYLSANDIRFLLEESDVFLLSSVQEGFCNAVIEAQSIGVPCIVSDAEGLSENIENEVTGFCIPKRDVKGIFNALVTIYNLPDEDLMRMQKQCALRVQSKYNVDDQIKQFSSMYLSLVN